MTYIITIRLDPGTLDESTLGVECSRIEPDPIFPDRILIYPLEHFQFKHNGSLKPSKVVSIAKSDVDSWYAVDPQELARLEELAKVRELSRLSVELSKAAKAAKAAKSSATPAPTPAPKAPTPKRAEVIAPARRHTFALDLDADDEEVDE